MPSNTTAFANFTAALDHAGYATDDNDVFHTVVELPTKFVFLCNGDGNLIVGVFHKATISGAGDYEGCPRYEATDMADALRFFAQVLSESV